MKLATPFRSLILAMLALLAALPALAITGQPITGYFGGVQAYPDGVPVRPGTPTGVQALGIVYDNTASAPNFGFSSTDLAATWGDELLTTAAGTLSQHKFTVFNGGSAGALLTATVGVQFFDAVTSTLFGGYTVNLNFGAGLNPGFFAVVTVTGLDPLLIGVNTTDIVVTQKVLAMTGPATRLGIASLNPPTTGSSPITMFINASTVGPAGFYTIGNPPLPANPGYQVGIDVNTVGVHESTWGHIRRLYR